jgi:signal transduction histidine kinase/DNA-binding response OmpR family regulator
MIKNSFNALSIKKKLILTIMGISSIMLLSTLSIFITSELVSLKQTMVEDLSTLANLVGKNSSGAILFYDDEAATENLLSLKAKPHIISVHLFQEQNLFAEYHKNKLLTEQKLPDQILSLIKQKKGGFYYIDDHIHMVRPIIFEADQSIIGLIHLQSDRDFYWQRVQQYSYTIIITMMIALLITLFFAYEAQKLFTSPLLILLESIQHVSTKQQYTMLIKNTYHDEFGELIEGYNSMLTQLEQHQILTTNYQLNLQQQVEERTLLYRKARDEAISASRLKSIFLANMSHEIRTPMNAILGYTQLLQQSQLNTEQSRKLAIIDKSGNHLLSLINDILELSKIEAGTIEVCNSDFDLLDLLDNVANMFQLRCHQKNISWKMESFNTNPLLVHGDQGKLRQILINLLGNACKFTDYGGVTFTIKSIKNNRYQFLIEDTGCGIATEALTNIFDTFHQEEQGIAKGGTGLGLNISKRYVELISGHLQVQSQLNQGSCFYFDIELPLMQKKIMDKTIKSSSVVIEIPQITSNKLFSALIVEDNIDNTELLYHFLTQLNFQVRCAKNGQIGLDKIRQQCPDIIFMDVRMPIMDGLEAIKIIRKNYSSERLKCVVVTASTLHHSIDYYIHAGFDLFISKPFRFDDISLAVNTLLGIQEQADHFPKEITTENYSIVNQSLTLQADFSEELLQAAEYGQLTVLKKLLIPLKKYGKKGEITANHLQLLIDSADLDGLIDYIKNIT